MINKFYSIILLALLAACNSGGGGGSGGSNNNPPPPNNIITEQTLNYSLQANQNIALGLINEGFSSVNFELSPSQGTITGTYPNLSYTASPSASGVDTARILLSKSGATKRLFLNFFINSIPVANNFSISLRFGQSLSFDLQGSDIDGDPLTYTIIQNPTAGTLYHFNSMKEVAYDSANSPYTTNFFYTVSDGKSTSQIGRVDIFVVSELPEFNSPTDYTLNEDSPQALTLSVSSATAHTYSVTLPPENGIISGTGANLIYTPNLDFFGTDSLKVKATNSQGGFIEQTINLVINNINDAPSMENQSISTVENTDTFIILPGVDSDNATLTYTKVNDTTLGISFISGDRLFYYPNLDTTGVDSLIVQVCDNGAPILCSQGTIDITIVRAPKVPIALDQNLFLSGGQSINITLSGTYYNINNVSVEILTTPTRGTLVHNGGLNYTYTANLDGAGEVFRQDFFSFTLTEEGLTSAQALVTLNIDYTPRYIGIDLIGGDFKEYSSLPGIIHQDLVDENSYALFENSTDPFGLIRFNMALSNLSFACPLENEEFIMLSTSTLSAQSGESLIIDSSYDCDGGILESSDLTETIYTNNNIMLRQINNVTEGMERTDAQIGIRKSSLDNNTSIGYLAMLSLNNFEKLSLDLANSQKTITTINSFSDLLIQENIAGQGVPLPFLKSDESILDFQNPTETLQVYHLVVESNGELILQEKYYSTPAGMRKIQDLYDDWAAENPDEEETLPLAVPAGRILIIGDSVLVNVLEQVSSYYEDDTLIYEYLEETKLSVLNRKVP